jgi:hypothetical protein
VRNGPRRTGVSANHHNARGWRSVPPLGCEDRNNSGRSRGAFAPFAPFSTQFTGVNSVGRVMDRAPDSGDEQRKGQNSEG